MNPAPSDWRTIRLLCWIATRRWLNKFLAFRENRNKKKNAKKRVATARKGGASMTLMAFFAVFFVFYGVMLSGMLLFRLEQRFDQFHVRAGVYQYLVQTEKNIDAGGPDDRQRLIEYYRPFVRDVVLKDLAAGGRIGATREADEIVARFESDGSAPFKPTHDENKPFDLSTLSPKPEVVVPLTNAISSLLALVSIALVFMSLGSGNPDIGKVEWSLEWLFSLPARGRAIMSGKLAEYALINPLLWFVSLPLLFVIWWSAGFTWIAVLASLLGTLYLGLVIGGARLVIETWMRLRLKLSTMKNLQALCTLLGLVFYFSLFWVAFSQNVPQFFIDWSHAMPTWLALTPLALPAIAPYVGWTPGLVAVAIVSLALPVAALVISDRLTRHGLIASSGAYKGKRNAPASSGGLLTGVLGKDIRLLLRDRNFLVQVVVTPILVSLFQLMINPALGQSLLGNFRALSIVAFGLGSYVLISSAFMVLSIEGNGLWMLYTLPRPLHRMMIDKTLLWAGLGCVYACIVMIVGLCTGTPLTVTALSDALMALIGVVVMALIAAALGSLSVDPLEPDVRRRASPTMIYLYMFLASSFGFAIHADAASTKVAQVVLSSLLAYALWQKVADRLPYLLDPIAKPPPRIGLSDGLVAVLAFFMLQGIAMVALSPSDLSLGAKILAAFVIAGGLVSLVTVLHFWRNQVANVMETIGLRRGEQSSSWVGAMIFGVCAGLVASVGAFAYTLALKHSGQMPNPEDDVLLKSDPSIGIWLAGLAVFAAPLFEEFIFRGLVFRGLRRSLPAAVSILASAGIFAIVHPPIAMVPVFGLGFMAALAFERTKLLAAPIVAHATYNAVVVVMSAVGQ